jgi:maltase-glucoamylase
MLMQIPLDYTLLPSPAISFKTSGGILDFFVLLADDPEHLSRLYTSLIGRPILPPYYGIGFQLTRYGYHSTDHVKKVIDRNIKAKIPMVVEKPDQKR